MASTGIERDVLPPRLGETGHDLCHVTSFCRRCGASLVAIEEGRRTRSCEPGVVGISHIRAVERLTSLFGVPSPDVPA